MSVAARASGGVAAALLCACASTPPRDSVPVGDEVRADAPTHGYEHVARRPHATLALAESRGLDAAEVRGATERLADSLEGCARAPGQRPGLLRVVAGVGDDGAPYGLNVNVAPDAAAVALRCVIAPLKLLVFTRLTPEVNGGPRRGFALEAEWR